MVPAIGYFSMNVNTLLHNVYLLVMRLPHATTYWHKIYLWANNDDRNIFLAGNGWIEWKYYFIVFKSRRLLWRSNFWNRGERRKKLFGFWVCFCKVNLNFAGWTHFLIRSFFFLFNRLTKNLNWNEIKFSHSLCTHKVQTFTIILSVICSTYMVYTHCLVFQVF